MICIKKQKIMCIKMQKRVLCSLYKIRKRFLTFPFETMR